MEKFLVKHKASIPLVFLAVVLIVLVSQASAQVATTGGGTIGASRGSIGKGRLEANKLRLCKVREKNITNRSSNMVAHAHRLVQVFDSITTRVENYYLSKLLPSGKILPSYDALVADIKVNKDAVTHLLQVAESGATNFKCDGDDPKGQLERFREDMRAVIAGLKTYKTSVRNLIVAVSLIKGTGVPSTAVTSVTP